MVETVINRRLYHVSVATPYKTALVANQSLKVGSAHNPFFGFYETSLEYPVTDNNAIVQIKGVNWLKRVQGGTIQTTANTLARIAVEVSTHYVMLTRELLMEEMRVAEFNGLPPSRQTCLYGSDTIEEARHWNQRLGGAGTLCELTCIGTIHRADARLLLADTEPLSVTKDRARQYWRGDVSATPELETLFAGDATVIGFGL